MIKSIGTSPDREVTLHTEGVDRNRQPVSPSGAYPMSPSTRRVWIEIPGEISTPHKKHVTLHTEGVDRNSIAYTYCFPHFGHPPHGGCG